jgi:hypothetical protein
MGHAIKGRDHQESLNDEGHQPPKFDITESLIDGSVLQGCGQNKRGDRQTYIILVLGDE